jgi:hypothetical protein
MIFIGDDWAEDHHDVYVMDADGTRLASRRLLEGLAGIRGLHELIAEHVGEPSDVVIGIETDRGLWVQALGAAGYQVFAVNPLAVARYRERHQVSGAKSDAGDAKVLADLVRTDCVRSARAGPAATGTRPEGGCATGIPNSCVRSGRAEVCATRTGPAATGTRSRPGLSQSVVTDSRCHRRRPRTRNRQRPWPVRRPSKRGNPRRGRHRDREQRMVAHAGCRRRQRGDHRLLPAISAIGLHYLR